MLYFGHTPGAAILWLPLYLLFAFATALAAGLWLSALNVQFRDIRFTIPFATNLFPINQRALSWPIPRYQIIG